MDNKTGIWTKSQKIKKEVKKEEKLVKKELFTEEKAFKNEFNSQLLIRIKEKAKKK